MKHILSLPTTCTVADPAVYSLTGAIPIEDAVHKRALTLFANVSRLGEDAIKKQLARRQLAVKGYESNSWSVAVKKLLVKYNLPECMDVLYNSSTKYS